jgi:hypothetical protein
MLANCWNLKHIDLGLDKRTIEDCWHDLTHAHTVWEAIANLNWWNLQTLRLSGFVLDSESLSWFLGVHKKSLTSLHFDNCYLASCWRAALCTLYDSSALRTLTLHQVTHGFGRVVWSVPYADNTTPLDDEDQEEWIYVVYAGCPGVTLEFEGRGTREYMNEVFESMRVTQHLASPFATDALDWNWPRLL